MNWKHWLLLLLIFTVACNAESVPLPALDSRADVPIVIDEVAGDSVAAEETPITDASSLDAGGYARAFYRAWEGGDYIGMYSLLSPQSQALVSSRAFVERYEEAMETARVLTVHAQPVSLSQEGNYAEFGVQVTWDTAVTGSITRDHTIPLVFDEGRWGIIWEEPHILPELESGKRLFMEYEIPSRASLYDINGQAMAFQGKLISLSIIPGQIQDEAGLLNMLNLVTGKTVGEIQALYADAQPDWLVPIADITETQMQDSIDLLQTYLGQGLAPLEGRQTRIYATNGVAPHIVGYTGFIPAEQIDDYLAEGYRGDEMVGLSGMEGWAESYLNGERGGTLSVIGSSGEYITTIGEIAPAQARSVYASIDLNFQAAVEQALADALNSHPLGQYGAVVVLDAQTGDVRAMASYPAYDPIIFDGARPNSDVELGEVLNNAGRPLINRAAQGAYPAGSVFKLVTMAAGLNSGQYTPQTTYRSTGTWNKLGEGLAKRDWAENGHGTITLQQALVVSCNSCFYDVGYNIDGQDNTLLPETAKAFGFGQPTNLQGGYESGGLIPDPQWKLENQGQGWAAGDAVNMAIGQGFVQVTPLQIANMMAAVANGGTLYQPKLIDRLGAGGGAPEEVWPAQANGRLPLSDEDLVAMKEALWNVANGAWGTATDKFVGLPLQVAGKTGTAEAPPNDPHAWFAGYAPAAPYTAPDGTTITDPEIAISVVVENAGEGSEVAAPIFRRVVELYYGLPVTPFPWER